MATINTRKIASLTSIKPIVDGEADIVIGDRQTSKVAHFSGFKKIMQRFGSWTSTRQPALIYPMRPADFGPTHETLCIN